MKLHRLEGSRLHTVLPDRSRKIRLRHIDKPRLLFIDTVRKRAPPVIAQGKGTVRCHDPPVAGHGVRKSYKVRACII